MTLLLIGWLSVASAHVPNIASYTLVEDDAAWHLDISLPTDGMHRSIGQVRPDLALSDLSVDEYESVLVAVLRDGVSLEADGMPLTLGEPVVGLAPHETHVQFPVNVSVLGVQSITAHIDALHEGGNQNNVFQLKTPFRQTRVVLSEANDFSGELFTVSPPAQPTPMAAVHASAVSPFAVLGVMLMSLFGVFSLVSRRTET